MEHAREAISDVSNVGLLNWERQSLRYMYGESVLTSYTCMRKLKTGLTVVGLSEHIEYLHTDET